MTQEKLKNLFDYDPRGFLLFKIRPQQSKNKKSRKAGTISQSRPGYRRTSVRIEKRLFMVHRLIFLFHYGFLPEHVDHINGNSLDNRIENLRPATNSENQRNKFALKRNSSGLKGIHFCKTTSKWRAQISIDRKRISLGRFETKAQAHLAYKKAAKLYHGAFANWRTL